MKFKEVGKGKKREITPGGGPTKKKLPDLLSKGEIGYPTAKELKSQLRSEDPYKRCKALLELFEMVSNKTEKNNPIWKPLVNTLLAYDIVFKVVSYEKIVDSALEYGWVKPLIINAESTMLNSLFYNLPLKTQEKLISALATHYSSELDILFSKLCPDAQVELVSTLATHNSPVLCKLIYALSSRYLEGLIHYLPLTTKDQLFFTLATYPNLAAICELTRKLSSYTLDKLILKRSPEILEKLIISTLASDYSFALNDLILKLSSKTLEMLIPKLSSKTINELTLKLEKDTKEKLKEAIKTVEEAKKKVEKKDYDYAVEEAIRLYSKEREKLLSIEL